jgi:hypothetical protein
MREKLFTLSRTQREAMWRRFKQTDDRRAAERLHAIPLPDSGQSAEAIILSEAKNLLRDRARDSSLRLRPTLRMTRPIAFPIHLELVIRIEMALRCLGTTDN